MSLMEELKSKILSGEIRPGAKLPSENELAQEYEISRHTVRKALAILVTDGYITTKHGKGTSVPTGWHTGRIRKILQWLRLIFPITFFHV